MGGGKPAKFPAQVVGGGSWTVSLRAGQDGKNGWERRKREVSSLAPLQAEPVCLHPPKNKFERFFSEAESCCATPWGVARLGRRVSSGMCRVWCAAEGSTHACNQGGEMNGSQFKGSHLT